jgi:hypothetical protein
MLPNGLAPDLAARVRGKWDSATPSLHHPHPNVIFRRDPKKNPAHTVGLESDRDEALAPCV